MGVVVKKDGVFRRTWVYNEEIDQGSDVDFPVESLLDVWYEKVDELEAGITLRDIIRLMGDERGIIEVLIREDLAPFIKEMDEPDPSTFIDDDPLTMCAIYCAPTLERFGDDNHYSFENYWGFHGMGTRENTFNYSLSWSHWSRFCDLPIHLQRLQPFCKVNRNEETKQWTLWETFDTEIQPEFGEMIHDIFFDLCFCGSPENRDAQSSECMKRLEEVKNGTAELVPFCIEDLDETKAD